MSEHPSPPLPMHEIIVDPEGMSPRELANSIRSLQYLLVSMMGESDRTSELWQSFHERLHTINNVQSDRDAQNLRDKFESINEVRAQLAVQKADFTTREYSDTRFGACEARISVLEKASVAATSERAATASTFRWIVLAVGFIGTMLGILTTVLVLLR